MNFLKFTREIGSFGTELKWSFVFIIGRIVWVAVERNMGFHYECLHAFDDFRHFVMVFFVICYLACLHEKKKKYDGERMRYWDGLVCSITMTILILVSLVPVNYLILNVISPDLLFNLVQYEIAHTHFSYQEIIERNTVVSYNMEYFTRFLLYGLGLSLILPLFVLKSLSQPTTRFYGNLS